MACVYELKFPNGKRYIGIANNFANRWAQHKTTANGSGKMMVQAAMRKYGTESVVAKILLEGPRVYVAQMEIAIISALNTLAPHGYNVALGGELSPASSPVGREKIRQSKLRHWADPDYRARISAANTGRVMTAEQNEKNGAAKLRNWADPAYREKVIASHTGRIDSDETRRAKGESAKRAWANPARAERGREAMAGRRWINNGVEHKQILPHDPIPSGWARGMLKRVA